MRFGRLEATGGFFLLLAWLNYMDRHGIVPLAMAACALHELGHYGMIRLMGGDIKLIRLTVVGAEMVLDRPLCYWREGVAALAGPGVNLLLAWLFCRWERGLLFSGLNLVLGCFNLLPVGQLDGGRALYCTLSILLGADPAQRIGGWLNLAFTLLLLGAGLLLAWYGGNITLLLVALWLLTLACKCKKSENRACHTRRKQIK